MTQNCKRFHCNQMKNIKAIPLEIRNKRRPIDVRVKVWKDIMKAYDRADARRKSSEESTQGFEFGHKIISNSLNYFYILPTHN